MELYKTLYMQHFLHISLPTCSVISYTYPPLSYEETKN